MNQKNLVRGLVLLMSLAAVACGGQFQAVSDGEGFGSQDVDQGLVNLNKVESLTEQAETAVRLATEEVEGLWKNKIEVTDTSSASGTIAGKSLTGLPEKLRSKLDKIHLRIQEPLTRARAAVGEARRRIVEAMATLDPNNPMRDRLLTQLTRATERLDQLEARLSSVFRGLADKGRVLLDRVDGLLRSSRFGSNPLLWIAQWELSQVKDVLAEFLDKLGRI